MSCNQPRSFTLLLGSAVNDHPRDTLTVKRTIAKHHFRRLAPPVIEMKVVLPGKPDPAVHLHTAIAHFAISVRAEGLRYRNRAARLGCVLGQSPRRIIGRRARALSHQQNVGALMLNGLESTDRTTELLTRLRKLDGRVKHPLHPANHLGTQRDRCRL